MIADITTRLARSAGNSVKSGGAAGPARFAYRPIWRERPEFTKGFPWGFTNFMADSSYPKPVS